MTLNARLEIHQMNVGQGDSILIINRDLTKVAAKITDAINKGKITGALPSEPIHYVPYAVFKGVDLEGTINRALLIDGGDDEYGGDVLNYLQKHGALRTNPAPYCPDLYLLISHPHDDHMAGLRSVFKERVETQVMVGKKKTTKVELVERFRPARVYQTSKNKKADPKTFRFAWLEEDVNGAFTAATNKTQRFFIDPGGFKEGANDMMTIDLGTGVDSIPIKLYALAAGQGVYDSKGHYTPITSTSKAVDQNDRSIVLILEYGSFRYFLGGDIAGSGLAAGGNTGSNAMNVSNKHSYSMHADVESALGRALEKFFTATTAWTANAPKYPAAGYCTVMKANHHGSSSSVDVYLLGTLRPCVAIVSSGVRSRFHRHPTQEVINRMSSATTARWGLRPAGKTDTANTIKQVYVTEVGDLVKNKAFSVDLRGAKIIGDIVIRPVDESIHNVHVSTAPGQQVSVQIYGSGDQTTLADPTKNTLRATEGKTGDYKDYAFIGPFYHTDTH
jgi:beta-lactamase superfamily II metal-dependent hydrolase